MNHSKLWMIFLKKACKPEITQWQRHKSVWTDMTCTRHVSPSYIHHQLLTGRWSFGVCAVSAGGPSPPCLWLHQPALTGGSRRRSQASAVIQSLTWTSLVWSQMRWTTEAITLYSLYDYISRFGWMVHWSCQKWAKHFCRIQHVCFNLGWKEYQKIYLSRSTVALKKFFLRRSEITQKNILK